MKILLYSLNFSPELTGIGKFSGEMATYLAQAGQDVHVVTAPPYYPEWKLAKGYSKWLYSVDKEPLAGAYTPSGSLCVTRCPIWIPQHPSGAKRLLHLASFALTSLPATIREAFWRPDVVVVIEPPLFCTPATLLISILSRSQSWLHIQDFEVDAAFELGLIKANWLRKTVGAVERWIMKRFDRVSTISNGMLSKLSDKDVPAASRLLFPNWVDTQQIFPLPPSDSLRHELGISSEHVVLLYSGNMGMKQGLELVIAVAKRLQDHPSIKFLMCGHGAAMETLKVQAESLANMRWIPLQPLSKLNRLLNSADIHLLPQKAGAADLVMPSKLTGMLASGKAVVATALEGTEVWDVVNGRGLNVPPGDVDAFHHAILTLAENKSLRDDLGAAGRSYAERFLQKDVILSQFLKELEGIRI